MRDTLVLLTARFDAAEVKSRILALEKGSEGPQFRYFLLRDCVFGVDVSGDVVDEYDEDERAEIQSRIGDFEVILIEYQDMACARGLLQHAVGGVQGILDTNYGDLIDYSEVFRRINTEPNWDLRRPSCTEE